MNNKSKIYFETTLQPGVDNSPSARFSYSIPCGRKTDDLLGVPR